MWNIIKEVTFNILGSGICILAICWAQHKLFELTEYFMPKPTKWASLKTDSAYKFYKGDKADKKNKILNPAGQREEGYQDNYGYDYEKPPIGLFSSTWTHFLLLMERLYGSLYQRERLRWRPPSQKTPSQGVKFYHKTYLNSHMELTYN